MQHEKRENAPAVESNERVSYKATGNLNIFLRFVLLALQITVALLLMFLILGPVILP